MPLPPAPAALRAIGVAVRLAAGLLLAGCLPREEERACADSARLDLPVDLAAFDASGSIWPHGAHGGAHPEGHPGIDFNLPAAEAEIPVLAPITGEIVAATGEASNPGSSCLILDSACLQVNLCHVRLRPGLGEGSRVRRGEILGSVAPVPGGGAYSLHLGTYVRSGDQQACPADFLDPDTVRCRLGESLGYSAPSGCGLREGAPTLMSRAEYPESGGRILTLPCADSTEKSFPLPAETSLCNARLPVETRAAMEACLGPRCSGVW